MKPVAVIVLRIAVVLLAAAWLVTTCHLAAQTASANFSTTFVATDSSVIARMLQQADDERAVARPQQALATLLKARSFVTQMDAKLDAKSVNATATQTMYFEVLIELTSAYHGFGLYDKAIESGFEAVALAEALGDERKIARAGIRLGSNYADLRQFSSALRHHRRALQIAERMGDTLGIAQGHASMAWVFELQEQYPRALEALTISLRLRRAINNTDGVGRSLASIGRVFVKQQRYHEALPYEREALAVFERTGNTYNRSELLSLLGQTYVHLGDTAEGLRYAEYALRFAEERSVRYMLPFILKTLADLHRMCGHFEQAHRYVERYAALKDSIFSGQVQQAISSLETARETSKQENALALQRLYFQFAAAGCVAALLVGAWIFRLYGKQRQTMKQVLDQQELLQTQTEEITITNGMLQEQNDKLLALDNEKNEIMGIVVHDLKNPISAVRGLAELIQYDVDNAPKIAGQMIITTERMLDLVKNLLDINHLESSALHLNLVTVTVQPIVASVVWQYQSAAAAKHITVHFVADTEVVNTIIADEQALIRVVDNLLSNAVKFTPHGKSVFVRLRAIGRGEGQQEGHLSLAIRHLVDEATNQLMTNQPMTNDQPTTAPMANIVRLEVRDEGPGLSADDMQKLFGKFARLSAQPTGGEHSTGLGLSIVKKLVEAMNGRVWCESELGKGATFVVELPVV
jgi:signal transduction histidine kinase